MDAPAKRVRPWVLLKREEAARRAGYNSFKEMKETQKKQKKRDKATKAKRAEGHLKADALRKALPGKLRKELDRCLVFQSQMGDRVRAAIKDREAGRRVVEENNANTRRIGVLRQRIQREEED